MVLDKKHLRKEIQSRLSKIPKPLYEKKSSQIANHLFHDDGWKNAHTIGMTISRAPEVDTYNIIKKGWEEGKQIVVPKCYPKERKMVFRLIDSFNQLETVYYGLQEPKEEETRAMDMDKIDLLIVPGLGFTSDGSRLGFGGGYYDRYLHDYHGPTLSLAFEEQIVAAIPMEKHDIKIKKIISERGKI